MGKKDLIFDICCEFLLLLSFAEHLILFLRRERKSFYPPSWTTQHFSLLLLREGPARLRLHAGVRSVCGQARNRLLLDVDSSIMRASAHYRSALGDVHNVCCLLLAVTIHLTETLRSIPRWLEGTGSKMLDASLHAAVTSLAHLGDCEAGMWCIILACFSFTLVLFG